MDRWKCSRRITADLQETGCRDCKNPHIVICIYTCIWIGKYVGEYCFFYWWERKKIMHMLIDLYNLTCTNTRTRARVHTHTHKYTNIHSVMSAFLQQSAISFLHFLEALIRDSRTPTLTKASQFISRYTVLHFITSEGFVFASGPPEPTRWAEANFPKRDAHFDSEEEPREDQVAAAEGNGNTSTPATEMAN